MIDPLDPLIPELRRVVQRIALMSHAPTQSYDVVMPGDDVPNTPPRWRLNDRREPIPHMGSHVGKGGDTMIPRGGIIRKDDIEADFRQKSHIYFERKLNRLVAYNGSTPADLTALLSEARQTLEDWCKTPPYDGEEAIIRGTFRWKCLIAEDKRDLDTIKRTYTVSTATVYRYRERYRGMRWRP